MQNKCRYNTDQAGMFHWGEKYGFIYLLKLFPWISFPLSSDFKCFIHWQTTIAKYWLSFVKNLESSRRAKALVYAKF